MLYNSIGMLILEIILYLIVYVVVIPLVLFILINILLTILKLRNKRNDKKSFAATIVVSIIFAIFLSNNINIIFNKKITSINGKKDSDLKLIINQIVDFKEKKTEIIYAKTKDIKIYTESKLVNKTVRRHSDRIPRNGVSQYEYYYYLNIRNGDFIIPLSDMGKTIVIKDLLYDNEYGEQVNFINKIEVYNNTKYIKSINGIDINSDYETREKFINEKEYKIKIKITEDGYLKYETEGCTLDEYINNENVGIAIYNELENLIVTTFQIFGVTDNLSKTFNGDLNINTLAMHCYPDGIYYAYVCKKDELGKIELKSNPVKFSVEKWKAIDFKTMN